jgi:hypothetical protein
VATQLVAQPFSRGRAWYTVKVASASRKVALLMHANWSRKSCAKIRITKNLTSGWHVPISAWQLENRRKPANGGEKLLTRNLQDLYYKKRRSQRWRKNKFPEGTDYARFLRDQIIIRAWKIPFNSFSGCARSRRIFIPSMARLSWPFRASWSLPAHCLFWRRIYLYYMLSASKL